MQSQSSICAHKRVLLLLLSLLLIALFTWVYFTYISKLFLENCISALCFYCAIRSKKIYNLYYISVQQNCVFIVYFFHPQLHNENTILVCNFSRGIFGIWLMCTHMGNTISKIEVQIAIPQWFGSRPVIHIPLLLRLLPCFKRNTKEPTTTNLSLSPSPLSLSAVPLSIVNSIVQKGRHHLLIEQFFELFFLILFIFQNCVMHMFYYQFLKNSQGCTPPLHFSPLFTVITHFSVLSLHLFHIKASLVFKKFNFYVIQKTFQA